MSSATRRVSVLAQHLLPNTSEQQAACSRLETAGTESSSKGMFSGQVVVITGAGKGIGEAAALMFAQQGAKLVLSDLDSAAVDAVAAKARELGADVVTVAGDITSADAPTRIVKAAKDSFGRLDVLVNNAGYTWDGVIHKMGERQWQAMLDVHVTAPFRLIQAATELMRDVGKQEMDDTGVAAPRSVINISSTSGTHGNAGQANYAAGKAAVVGLTKTVAKEWGPYNVRCNAIAYGLIDTRLTRPKDGGEAIVIGGQQVITDFIARTP